ncbi:MarR family winged helix-turn-helix transcriptional regulator [Microbacterium sp. GXF0217]
MSANDLRIETWRRLLRGQRAMMLRLTVRLKREFDLTAAQYEALQSLNHAGGTMTAARLARDLLYSSGSATHLLARLEERGLIIRVASPTDGRVVDISLTEEGQALITAATAAHIADVHDAFSPLIPDDEISVLVAFARRLEAAEHADQAQQRSGRSTQR